jgi:hypothetical protein
MAYPLWDITSNIAPAARLSRIFGLDAMFMLAIVL